MRLILKNTAGSADSGRKFCDCRWNGDWTVIRGSSIIQSGREKDWDLALGYPAFVLEIRPETNEVVIGEHDDESMTDTVRADHAEFHVGGGS